jgi:hypothetical protein
MILSTVTSVRDVLTKSCTASSRWSHIAGWWPVALAVAWWLVGDRQAHARRDRVVRDGINTDSRAARLGNISVPCAQSGRSTCV